MQNAKHIHIKYLKINRQLCSDEMKQKKFICKKHKKSVDTF